MSLTVKFRTEKAEKATRNMGFIAGTLTIAYTAGGDEFRQLERKFKALHWINIETDGTHVLQYDRDDYKVKAVKISDGTEPAATTAITTYFLAAGEGGEG